MGKKSHIQWTNATWNAIIGCRKVSPGCMNCYAERWAERMGRTFRVVERAKDATFYAPLKWKEPQLVFTCSLSDFFIEEADPFRSEMWDIIRGTPHLTYQILTKRPERIQECLPEDWGHKGWSNVWLGTSIESQKYDFRIVQLVEVPAVVHFLSCEPLLGPLNLDFDPYYYWFLDIEWVITGGESEPRKRHRLRKADPDWFRAIRDQCLEAKVPFFHKQNGGRSVCECHRAWGCRLLDGREWNEFPASVHQKPQPTLETF